jgi:hypothetical protein
MTRRDWWLGIGAVVVAILLHAAIPRYAWRDTSGPYRQAGLVMRIDRWTGHADVGRYDEHGRWEIFEQAATTDTTRR